MCFFIHALEELYSYCHHDFFRVFAPPFAHSEIVLGCSIYRNWYGVNTVKREVLAISHIVNQEQVDIQARDKSNLQLFLRYNTYAK